jgi:hypothetical protein
LETGPSDTDYFTSLSFVGLYSFGVFRPELTFDGNAELDFNDCSCEYAPFYLMDEVTRRLRFRTRFFGKSSDGVATRSQLTLLSKIPSFCSYY